LIIVIAVCVLSDDASDKTKPCLWPASLDQNSSVESLWPFHRHRMPPFLKHVGWMARWEYYAIIRNPFTTMNDKLKKVHKWAKKQGPDVEKGVDIYFDNIKKYWSDVNKNTTKVLEELPKVYPKVYEILSNLDYTYQDMYNKIRDLHIDKATYYSLHAVVFMVVHTVGSHGPYLADTEMFLESKLIFQMLSKL
ncbi:hypothetical protein COOONC_18530, partial [Cooperia oncophora]